MLLGQSRPVPRSAWLALAAIALLGAALRFYALGKDSFWMDELIRVTESRMNSFAELRAFLRGDVHPPGYILLLTAVTRCAGGSEWDYRLPSALAGVLVIPILFLLGNRLYSHREGLAAAAFTAVLWCPISYSQEAAPYMILIALTAGATCLWLPLVDELRETGRVRFGLAAGYAVCASLAYYTHFFGIFFFGLQAVASFLLCLRRPRALGWVFGIYAASVAGFGPWLPDFLTQLTSRHATAAWMKPPPNSAFLRFVRHLFDRENLFVWIVLSFYALLFIAALRESRRALASNAASGSAPAAPPHGSERGGIDPSASAPRALFSSPGFLLTLWFAVPFALVFTVSKLGKPMLQERYLLISMAPAYLLLARSVMRLPELFTRSEPGRGTASWMLAAALTLAFAADLIFVKDFYRIPQHTQFREAVAWTVDHGACAGAGAEGTIVIGYLGGAGLEYMDYYFERAGSPARPRFSAGTMADLPNLEAFLKKERPARVLYLNAHVDADKDFLKALATRLTEIDRAEFKGAKVWLFENPKR